MAKKRNHQTNGRHTTANDLPAPPKIEEPMQVLDPEPQVTAPEEPAEIEAPCIEPEQMRVLQTVPVDSIPMAVVGEHAYATKRIDLRLIREDASLAKTLKQLHEGLYKSAATLPGGRHIKSPADALKWLLYNIQSGSVV